MGNPESNMRRVLSVIWREDEKGLSYHELNEIFIGILTERQVYDAIRNLKDGGLIRVKAYLWRTNPPIKKTPIFISSFAKRDYIYKILMETRFI